jgi:hypothetical protein
LQARSAAVAQSHITTVRPRNLARDRQTPTQNESGNDQSPHQTAYEHVSAQVADLLDGVGQISQDQRPSDQQKNHPDRHQPMDGDLRTSVTKPRHPEPLIDDS